MSIDELKHIMKTGKHIRIPHYEGDIGIIERKLGKGKIRIKFKISESTIWIITVEGGRTK
jgi:hypothetical protein